MDKFLQTRLSEGAGRLLQATISVNRVATRTIVIVQYDNWRLDTILILAWIIILGLIIE